MKKYEIAGGPLSLRSGRLSLTPAQAAVRMHALAETPQKNVYTINGEVQFKAGEVIGLDGEIPKSLQERLVDPGSRKTVADQKVEAGVDVKAIRAEAAKLAAEAAKQAAADAFKVRADAVRAALADADVAVEAVNAAAAALEALPPHADPTVRADAQAAADAAGANADTVMAAFRQLVAGL